MLWFLFLAQLLREIPYNAFQMAIYDYLQDFSKQLSLNETVNILR